MVVIFICIGLFVVTMLYFSDRWGTTFGGTIWVSTKTVLFWIKQMIPKKEIQYPSGIGYDVNGCFCPGAVEDEFSSLRDTLDGLYLSNHLFSNELFQYVFKYARVKNDIGSSTFLLPLTYICCGTDTLLHIYLYRSLPYSSPLLRTVGLIVCYIFLIQTIRFF